MRAAKTQISQRIRPFFFHINLSNDQFSQGSVRGSSHNSLVQSSVTIAVDIFVIFNVPAISIHIYDIYSHSVLETYRRRVVSLSKTLYSPKVLVNYPGSDGSVPI